MDIFKQKDPVVQKFLEHCKKITDDLFGPVNNSDSSNIETMGELKSFVNECLFIALRPPNYFNFDIKIEEKSSEKEPKE